MHPTPDAQAEQQLCELVVAKAINAKVDRPSGLIQFGKRQVTGHGAWWKAERDRWEFVTRSAAVWGEDAY